MARYFHEIDDEVFEIDVCAMMQGCAAVSPFFVAYVSRLDRSELVPIMTRLGRREVYGPTEAWAVQNARDLLASRSRSTRETC